MASAILSTATIQKEAGIGTKYLLIINPSDNNDNNVLSQRNLVLSVSYSLEAPTLVKERKE
jgi:hypothetical protein